MSPTTGLFDKRELLMNIDKKDRSQLKSYFVKNSIPTEKQFAELIDGMLNQKDDGIAKSSVAESLSIQAAIDTPTGLKKVINFYDNFQDTNPAWTLLLNPRTDPVKPETAKSGFCISDGLGVNRLFIDSNTGNVGIGTITPKGILEIANLVCFGLDEGSSGSRSISFVRDKDDEINAGKITYKGGFGSSLNFIGAGIPGSPRKIKLYDNVEVNGTLQVNSDTRIDGSLDIANLVRFGLNEGSSGSRSISFVRDKDDEINAGKITYKGGFGSSLNLIGAGIPGSPRKIKLYDNVEVNGTLQVNSDTRIDGSLLVVAGIIAASSSSSPPPKNPNGVPNAVSGIRFSDNPGGGSYDAAWIQYYARSGESCTLEIGISNDADDHIALMPSGHVGIGTTNPGAKLDIMATTTAWGGWLEAIRFSRTEHSAITHPGGNLLFGMHSDRHFYFADTKDGKYVMTINATTGNVGIGTNIADFRLDIVGRARIRQTSAAAESAGIWFSSYYAQEINAAFVGMQSLNQVGFYGNTGTAGWRLLVNTSNGDLNVTGNALKPGGGAWGSNSDERLKQNIRPLEGALDKLLKLRGVQYEWKEPEKQGNLTGCQIGLIAQEVETVFPEWIGVDTQGYKTLTIRGFEALVIEAIKELRVENENLRKYCESLETRLKIRKAVQAGGNEH
jgi:hypothetical protein